jgi:hypothetical protein
MGIFDRFRKKSRDPEPPEDDAAGVDEYEDDWDSVPPDAVAIVREGHNVPSDEDMRQLLAAEMPDCVDLPRTGLNQMRWWKESGWVGGGMMQIATALRGELGIDPVKTTWRVCKDDRGARCGIVLMRR